MYLSKLKHFLYHYFIISLLMVWVVASVINCSGGGGGSSSNTYTPPPEITTPPDPATIAPPIDRTVATTIGNSTAFLYTGSNAVQTGLTAGTIVPTRAAVVRGHVLDRDNNPLSGVRVTILNHPEFGQTLSRSDGMFDLAVNGGNYLTINYEKSGYLPVQRQLDVAWQDFSVAPDIVMVALDNEVTKVQMSASDIQVARGKEVSDQDGTRRATLLFTPGTTAALVLPDGTTQSVNALNIRATEYTVGENGPEAMPAKLPPNTGYTYAVELSADEAIAANATTVRFSKPIYTYVENFISAPVGSAVPTGYYNHLKGQWTPTENGRVIKILGINAGIALLDTDGDGVEDNASVLADLNITTNEQQKIASLYSNGQELWRVPIEHLSAYDCNWPVGPPMDIRRIKPKNPWRKNPEKKPCSENGSIIECQNQTLGERIGLIGTSYDLNYRSDRMRGRKAAYSLEIPIAPDEILPQSLLGIFLEIHVAGRVFKKEFTADPNQTYTFVWDGLDAYGREVQGEQPINVILNYRYPSVVYPVLGDLEKAFGRLPYASYSTVIGASNNMIRRGGATYVNRVKWSGNIGSQNNASDGLGGWSLSVHHTYSPISRTLYLGNGDKRTGNSFPILKKIAGNNDIKKGINEGKLATDSFLNINDIAITADGSLLIVNRDEPLFTGRGAVIFKVAADGNLNRFAGTGEYGHSDDGVEAIKARFEDIGRIDIGEDGSVFFIGHYAIRKIDPDGIISTVAGTGIRDPYVSYYADESKLATDISLNFPRSITVSSDGDFYFSDNNKILKVNTDGILTVVAGTDNLDASYYNDINGSYATQAAVGVSLLDIAPNGELYFQATNNAHDYNPGEGVYKIKANGIIERIAGGGTHYYDGKTIVYNNQLATKSYFPFINDIAVGKDGNIYIASDIGIHVVDHISGLLTTVAGNGRDYEYPHIDRNGVMADSVPLIPFRMSLSPNGEIYFYNIYRMGTSSDGVYKRTNPLPGFSLTDISIVSEDGKELYKFDASGKHLATYDTLSAKPIYTFAYNDAGLLKEIKDRDGLKTRIERNSEGEATAIISPYGERTTLQTNSDGYLSSIADPLNEKMTFTYHDGGLLATMQYPKGGMSKFTYDTSGMLIKDEDPSGGYQMFSRSDDDTGYSVTRTTAMGRVTHYRTETLPTGEHFVLNTNPDGTWYKSLFGREGNQTTTFSDGTVITMKHGPDPRFGMQAPVLQSLKVTLPTGLTKSITQSRSVELLDPKNKLSLQKFEDNITINGKSFMYQYDADALKVSTTTPLGYVNSSTLNDKGRVTQIDIANTINPISFAYDAEGHVIKASQGTQYWSYSYDKGRAISKTDASGLITQFAYDTAGRMTSKKLPAGNIIGYGYDKNSNLTQVIMPSSDIHTLQYTKRNLLSKYTPPQESGVSYSYDLDKARTFITLASNKKVTNSFDMQGHWTSSVYPAATIERTYNTSNGKLETITRTPSSGNSAQSVSYSYNGGIVSGIDFGGVAEGIYSYGYNNDFLVSDMNLSSGSDTVETNIIYNDDNLVVKYGPFTFTRNGPDGTISQIKDNALQIDVVYDAQGRVQGRSYSVNGSLFYSYVLTYDNIGRITKKVEISDGVSKTYEYAYDANTQLTGVTLDGTKSEAYTYDKNGNRLSTLTLSASYSKQDRLLKLGSVDYQFDKDGYLTAKGDESFEYSALGELLKVTLSDGKVITYSYDGNRRCVGSTDDAGSFSYLYGDPGNPFRITAIRHPNGDLSTLYYDGEGHLYAMQRANKRYYIASDQVGTPKLIVDTAGTVVKVLEYDSFGKLTNDSNSGFDMPIGFAGGIADTATGMVRFGMRDYDVTAGRWNARDPILFDGLQANLYVYVGSNPVSLRDPMGIWCIGASAYALVGGGAEVCCNNGKCSVCGELGFGIGASAELGSGDAKQTGSTLVGDASVGCGPLTLGFGVGYNVFCGFKAAGKAAVGPLSVDDTGDVKVGKGLGESKPGCSSEAKVVGRHCGQF